MEKITIVKIGRKSQPSKFKPGETYNITTVMDDKNRKLVAMGAWADSWKIGDVIEVEISEKKWTDKDGFEQTSLNLANPNKKPWTGGQGGGTNPTTASWQIAAQLAPLFFVDSKKKIKLDDISALADEIKKRISTPDAASTEKVKEIDVTKDEQPVAKSAVKVKDEDFDEEEIDDDKPF